MFNKSMIALTAAIAFGSVSSAFAYEDPENKLGDRYPFLEQRYSYERTSAATARNVQPRQYAVLPQYVNEDPENRISDRYPFLEQALRPVVSSRFVGATVAQRLARAPSSNNAYANEAPENRIGDRYPLLEATYGRVPSRVTTVGRSRQPAPRT